MKRLLFLVSLFLVITTSKSFSQDEEVLLGEPLLLSQNDLQKPLPSDAKVRTGVLPNGMRYYIRYNKKPEKRAELRLAVNSGSTSENDDQRGLAHLTEHMAFNGTKNFSKNQVVDYLESVGTKFGPHLNAYTSFDETVYMIQIPTDTDAIVQKGLQILEDWSHNLSFDSSEVEKERGVVVEEWRLGQGAQERMRRKYWPVLFTNSRYAERLPIGKKEIIEHSKQSTLRNFYYDWYRPDNEAIIAVGDFDVDKMEKWVKEKFAAVPSKTNERKVEAYPVPDTQDLLVSTGTDKEATMSIIQLIYKQPVEKEVTESDYRKSMAERLFNSMLNARLSELQHVADPPYVFASTDFGHLVRTKYAYSSYAGCKEDGIEKALTTVLTENERVRRYGFTQTELDRQKNEALRQMEKSFNEREKTESKSFAGEYVRNYLNHEPFPGIEYEYTLHKKYLPGITLAEVNAFAKKWITDGTNAVVIITAPEKATTKMPAESRIKDLFKSTLTADVKPYEDKVLSTPLVVKEPAPAKVVDTKEVKEYNITEWKLANGARVILKPTDFKNDEILFTATSYGGSSLLPDKDYMSAAYADEIINESGLGEYDANALEKYMSGKIANVSPYISDLTEGLSGSCAPKDLETMMQMVYMYFEGPRKDATAFSGLIKQQQTYISNKNSDPNATFRDTISYAWNSYNYRYRPLSSEILKEINLDKAYSIYRQRFTDASNFMFFFVGNFKLDEIKPFVEKYIGGLPSTNSNELWKDLGVKHPSGQVEKMVKKGIEPKSNVVIRYSMPFEYNRNNRNEVTALVKLVNIKLRESLREEKSGVYGVSCSPNIVHYPKGWLEMTIQFGCAPENVDMLVKAANDVVEEIKKKGSDEKNLTKVKEISLREREVGLKENQFWLGTLSSNYMNGENILDLLHYNDWVNSLQGEDFRSFAIKYLKNENYAKFVLMPEK